MPLTLRKELFGGILFDPSIGTHVELDAEGFELAKRWLVEGTEPASESERKLAESLQEEVPGLGASRPRVRLIELDLPGGPYRYATVLASPTLVDFQITTRCHMRCPHCYAGSNAEGEHVETGRAIAVLEELAKAGVCQLAIGGGEPLLHPGIRDIIRAAHELGMVPNLTTTGGRAHASGAGDVRAGIAGRWR